MAFDERRFTETMRARYGTEIDGDELHLLRLTFASPVQHAHRAMVGAVRWALISGFLGGVAFVFIALALMGRFPW